MHQNASAHGRINPSFQPQPPPLGAGSNSRTNRNPAQAPRRPAAARATGAPVEWNPATHLWPWKRAAEAPVVGTSTVLERCVSNPPGYSRAENSPHTRLMQLNLLIWVRPQLMQLTLGHCRMCQMWKWRSKWPAGPGNRSPTPSRLSCWASTSSHGGSHPGSVPP